MKINNGLHFTQGSKLSGKKKDPAFSEPRDMFTPTYPGDAIGFGSALSLPSSMKFVGAPDKSAGGWVVDNKETGYPKDAIGFGSGDVKDSSEYPGDAIGFGSALSLPSSMKFVGAPDKSAGGWIVDNKETGYPKDAIGFGSGDS